MTDKAARMAELRAMRDSYLLLDRKSKASPKRKAAFRAATAELNRLAGSRPAKEYLK